MPQITIPDPLIPTLYNVTKGSLPDRDAPSKAPSMAPGMTLVLLCNPPEDDDEGEWYYPQPRKFKVVAVELEFDGTGDWSQEVTLEEI